MIWFIAGAAIAYLISAVFAGSLMQQQADRIRELQAELFTMEQDLLDALEGQQYPKYVMRSDGVESVVERNRPDIHTRYQSEIPDGAMVVDLTSVENEEL